MSDTFTEKKEILKSLFISGFFHSVNSHELLFKSIDSENRKTEQLIAATTHLSEAHAIYTQINIFLTENIDILGEREELNENIQLFDVYNKEVLKNIASNHSHQWSDIEFRYFVESFKPVAELLEIPDGVSIVEEALKD
ncbi:MAG: hypothetical protein L0L58_10360 [Tetragenococcus koreensis]|nr:hypothetical protein [Tetragenococcus koreensis]MDN6735910.1 hypothetical protein [Tetragenococcus koreensis]